MELLELWAWLDANCCTWAVAAICTFKCNYKQFFLFFRKETTRGIIKS